MDGAEAAAGRYAAVTSLRQEVAQALVTGDNDVAYRAASDAFRLLDENLSSFADLASVEATPYRAQAVALFGDAIEVGVALGEPRVIFDIVESLSGQAQGLFEQLRVSGYQAVNMPLATPRRCPHGRGSWNGDCLSIPPCPPSGS